MIEVSSSRVYIRFLMSDTEQKWNLEGQENNMTQWLLGILVRFTESR